MKKAICSIFLVVLSLSLWAQEEPEWVRDAFKGGIEITDTSVLYVGCSSPIHTECLERHLAAIYNALAEYSISRYSEISNSDKGFFAKSAALLDFCLLDDWVSRDGYEYVRLKITPGKHYFYRYFRDDPQGRFESMEFSAFKYPMKTSVTYEHTGNTVKHRVICEIGAIQVDTDGSIEHHAKNEENEQQLIFDREQYSKEIKEALEEYRKSHKND